MELALLTTALLARYDITLVDPKQVCNVILGELISGFGIGSLDDKYTTQTSHRNSIESPTACIAIFHSKSRPYFLTL